MLTLLSAPARTGPEAHPSSHTVGTGSFPGVKRPEGGTEVKETVKLQLYSPTVPTWQVIFAVFTILTLQSLHVAPDRYCIVFYLAVASVRSRMLLWFLLLCIVGAHTKYPFQSSKINTADCPQLHPRMTGTNNTRPL